MTDSRWDESFVREEVAAERAPVLRRLIAWHTSRSRSKWLIEHGAMVVLVGTLTFFFGVYGLVSALLAFVLREIAMALLIEGIVAIVLRKAKVA